MVAVYRAASDVSVLANSTAPFFTVSGVANKIMYIKRVYIDSPTATNGAFLNIGVDRCSSDASGGTSVTLTNAKIDIESPDSSAVVKIYSVAPTSGTVVARLSSRRVYSHKATPSADGLNMAVELLKAEYGKHPVMLKGEDDHLCIYFLSTPGSAVTCTMRIEWSEEG